MEYKRAFELASSISENYCKNAQIFLTTHSPAFIDLTREGQSVYMAKRHGADTVFTHLTSAKQQKISEIDPEMLIADELGHIKLMKEMHDKLQERLRMAEEAKRNLDAALKQLAQLNRPVLLTEGKTDVLILKKAWEKRKQGPLPFEIKSCNVLGDHDMPDAAGAAQLAMCLRSIMSDHPHAVIGLFDRDDEGTKHWKLDKNFKKFESHEDVKGSNNGKAFAILLPVPRRDPDLAKSKHHCTEFMFPLETLKKSVDGKSLLIEPLPLQTRCGDTIISSTPGTEIWQMRVVGGKKAFAETVVPTLEAEEFESFDQIFELIDLILQTRA